MDDEHSSEQSDASTVNPSLYHSTISQLDSSTAVTEDSDKEHSIEQQLPGEIDRRNNGQHENTSLADNTEYAQVELSSDVREELRNELKEKIEDMEGDIIQVRNPRPVLNSFFS